MYEVLAKYYDKLNNCDYLKWSQYLLSFIDKRGGAGADLACGTGLLTNAFARAGYLVTGVDISAKMLDAASKNSRLNNPLYICQDIRKLRLPGKYDFIVCACDGVNYLSPAEAAKLFLDAKRLLKEDGVFLFDISSEYKLKEIIGDNVFFYDLEDVTCLWSNKAYADYVEFSLTFFTKAQGGLYARADETHKQYAHKTADITNALLAAGFSDVCAYEHLTHSSPIDSTERIQFAAK